MLELSNRLQSDGIDSILDQRESFPPHGWIQWMKDQIGRADFVLMVFSEGYGVGRGTTYEGQIIEQHLYDARGKNERFIPVVFTAEDLAYIPLELKRYKCFQLDRDPGYEDLRRLLAPSQAKSEFRHAAWNVPDRNPNFTGRETDLDAIHQAFTRGRVALSGIGGIGKTQTAIEYAHRHRGEYESVLWGTADSDASLLSAFAVLANLLELPAKAERDLSVVADGVRRWLESNSGWLLILDNVDTVEEMNLVRRLVPAGSGGRLVVTTRMQAVGPTAELVELKKLTPQEGAQFLLRRTRLTEDRASAERISRDVDGLPLALDQAGAFIVETPSTFSEYLKLYRTEGAKLRKLRGDLGTDHPSVTVTFSLAFSKLEAKNPAAADLVRMCAFLAPDAIPEEIFALKPLDLAEAVKDAGRLALIRRNATPKTIDVHRQVQEVLKDGLDVRTQRLWAERIVEALARVFPDPEFRNWPQCERLLPHARAAVQHVVDFGFESESAGHLLNGTGHYLDDRAEYAEAEALYQHALALHEKAFGPEGPETAASLNNLAALYRSTSRYEEAEPLFRRALGIRNKALGPDHPGTAESLNNLAVLLRRQDRYNEAEPLHQQALAIREKALGPDHSDTAQSLNNLALLYYMQGRYEEADPLYRRALAIDERALGSDHPETAVDLNNLAALYADQGRCEEAETLYLRALPIFEKALGSDHPYTVGCLANYKALLSRLSDQSPGPEPPSAVPSAPDAGSSSHSGRDPSD